MAQQAGVRRPCRRRGRPPHPRRAGRCSHRPHRGASDDPPAVADWSGARLVAPCPGRTLPVDPLPGGRRRSDARVDQRRRDVVLDRTPGHHVRWPGERQRRGRQRSGRADPRVLRPSGNDSDTAVVTGAGWVCMALAAGGLWIRRRPPLTLGAPAAAPFLTLVQNYGDEGVLRVFLFSSPFAALLIADLVVTTKAHRAAQAVVLITCVALGPLFVL